MSSVSNIEQNLAENSEFLDVTNMLEYIEADAALAEISLLNPEFGVEVRRIYVNLVRVSGSLSFLSTKIGFLKRQQEHAQEALVIATYVRERTNPKSKMSVDDAKKLGEHAANRVGLIVMSLTNAKAVVDDKLKALDQAIRLCDGLLRSLTVEARRGL